MSGSPTETEVQTQWRNAVAILESARAWADGTLAGQLDTLIQSLEGEYTPALATLSRSIRAGASDLISGSTARTLLEPVFYEYARLLGFGSGFTTIDEIAVALRQHFVDNSLSVRSRGLTFGTPAADGGNTGNGSVLRLIQDRYAEDIESVFAEVKRLRCIADQNSGAFEHAERFEVVGEASSQDALLRTSFGSSESIRQTITALHAGTGQGGSILRNSSFAQFNATDDTFTGWTIDSGAANVTQESGQGYRGTPQSSALSSLRLNGNASLSQALTTQSFRPGQPYRLRVMVNGAIGSASGGSVTLTIGAQTKTVLVSALSGWTELAIDLDENSYFENFNADGLSVSVSWSSASSGYVLLDDLIFAPLTQVDSTWLCVVGGATPFKLEDEFTITDTGGAAGTGEIQYWLWVAGLGYLPSVSSSETFTDPA